MKVRITTRGVVVIALAWSVVALACGGPAPTPVSDITLEADEWRRQFGSQAADEASSVAVDRTGNVYVAGWTEGDLSELPSAGMHDAFLRRYDSDGKEQWTRQFGSAGEDTAEAVAVGRDGGVYVVGGAGHGLPGQVSLGDGDAFLRKYDSGGAKVWTRQFGSSKRDWADGVAVDGEGNVYVTGSTLGALPGQASAGTSDNFVRKYNSSGGELWTRQFGAIEGNGATGVAVDAHGNVYVTGSTLGPLPGQSRIGTADAFVRVYDPAGNELWTRQYGSVAGDAALAVAVGGAGNVYIVGSTRGVLPDQVRIGGFLDAFIIKYDETGTLVWARQFGSTDRDLASGVAIDAEGNVYVGGRTGGSLTGRAGNSKLDAFLRKYSPSGEPVWTRQFGADQDDLALSVATDGRGSVFAVGSGILPGLPAAGGKDAVVVKFSQSR